MEASCSGSDASLPPKAGPCHRPPRWRNTPDRCRRNRPLRPCAASARNHHATPTNQTNLLHDFSPIQSCINARTPRSAYSAASTASPISFVPTLLVPRS
jgi:hypothetical protein